MSVRENPYQHPPATSLSYFAKTKTAQKAYEHLNKGEIIVNKRKYPHLLYIVSLMFTSLEARVFSINQILLSSFLNNFLSHIWWNNFVVIKFHGSARPTSRH